MSGSFHSRIRDTKKAFVPLCARRLIPATTSVRMLPFNPIPWLYVGNPVTRAGIKVGETPLARSGRNPRLVETILAKDSIQREGPSQATAMESLTCSPCEALSGCCPPARNPLNIITNGSQTLIRIQNVNRMQDLFAQLRTIRFFHCLRINDEADPAYAHSRILDAQINNR